MGKIDIFSRILHLVAALLVSALFLPIAIGLPLFVVRDLINGESPWLALLFVLTPMYLYVWWMIAIPSFRLALRGT